MKVERLRAPPGPGCAQPAPRGGQENLGRPGVFLRARTAQTASGTRRHPATMLPGEGEQASWFCLGAGLS
ncbi:MAG: hypothetical protein B7X36_10510 [Thiomonas sp. 14-64-326]|nr:MAG: hypothetical protein B7X36_10510 [Thiomonas sp. 14-64-326]